MPDLYQCLWHRPACSIEHKSAYDDPFASRRIDRKVALQRCIGLEVRAFCLNHRLLVTVAASRREVQPEGRRGRAEIAVGHRQDRASYQRGQDTSACRCHQWLLSPAAIPPRSHRLLEFENEFIHRLVWWRLDREIARVLWMTPENSLRHQPEAGRLNLAAQRTLFHAMQGLADRGALAGSRGVVRDHQRSARL